MSVRDQQLHHQTGGCIQDLDQLRVADDGAKREEEEEVKRRSSGGGWKGLFSFWRKQPRPTKRGIGSGHGKFSKVRLTVNVKRAEKLKEEALFYGGGEIKEIADGGGSGKENERQSGSAVVCLSYKAMEEAEDGGFGSTQIVAADLTSSCTASASSAIAFVSSPPPPLKSEEHDMTSSPPATGVVTQIDYVNYFIPYLTEIISCPYYWGKIDRYEAEALLESKPEGSFLFRDSAQDEFVFSVSFRRYNRSLHARIEESRHQFSFDCHDPGVHRARSVCGLLEHYKDPLSCMFFEPMLLYPVPRRKTFSLQELARAAICDRCTYGRVSQLPLPQTLKAFLREYSYKHKFRTRQLDCSVSRQNAQLATEAAAAAGRR